MKWAILNRSFLLCWLAPLAGVLAEGTPPPQADAPSPDHSSVFRRIEKGDWTHHLRLGALAGFNISADFVMEGTFGLSGSPVAGVYDDGYVLIDDTGNAGGMTANWGYNNASQVSGSTLSMHRTANATTSGSSHQESDLLIGGELAYGQDYWKWGPARIGWQFGFGWLPIQITDSQSWSASAERSSFLFDTFGNTIPTAPYQGTSVSAGAPVISADPTAGPSETTTGLLTGTRKLDTSLFTFKLGPSVHFDLGRNFGLRAGGGPALGFVTGDYEFDETLILSNGSTPNKGSVEMSQVVFGGYLEAMLTYRIRSERGDVFLGVQYLPLGDASGSNQGRGVSLNLGGQVGVMAGAHWTF